MSARPSQVRAAIAGGGTRVPTARPPVDSAPVLLPELGPSPWNWKWWTPEARQGWIGSVGMHALLLIVLACWYFAPRSKPLVAFDSRLAGSPHGIPEAEALTGGLNTALPMPAAPFEMAVSTAAPSLTQMELATLEPDPRFGTSKVPTGGGGAPNDNPGAGEGDGFGLARFGEGGELVQGVEVKVGDPQFTLIWDKDGVDLDLHVEEPGGKEIYWEEPKGARGGELDVDNTKGFGPENVYWLVESQGPGSEKIKGPGPAGTYRWFVVYYGGFGGVPKPTHWQVRVKHDGKVTVHHGKFRALNERSKIYTLKVEPSGAKAPASASTVAP